MASLALGVLGITLSPIFAVFAMLLQIPLAQSRPNKPESTCNVVIITPYNGCCGPTETRMMGTGLFLSKCEEMGREICGKDDTRSRFISLTLRLFGA